MRSLHKAELRRRNAALELVLEHPSGQALLEASDGDAEHALRIIETLEERRRGALAEVISLPREPILELVPAPYDRELDPVDEPARGVDWLIAIGLGLLVWLVLAAAAFVVWRMLR